MGGWEKWRRWGGRGGGLGKGEEGGGGSLGKGEEGEGVALVHLTSFSLEIVLDGSAWRIQPSRSFEGGRPGETLRLLGWELHTYTVYIYAHIMLCSYNIFAGRYCGWLVLGV